MARTRRSASSANLPLTPEQLLELDNVSAAKKVPSDIASRLSTRKLVISGARGLKPEKSEVKGAYEVTLPERPWSACRGRRRRACRGPRKQPAGRSLAGHRPDWMAHVHHPKRAKAPHWAQGPVERSGVPGRGLLRRLRGRGQAGLTTRAAIPGSASAGVFRLERTRVRRRGHGGAARGHRRPEGRPHGRPRRALGRVELDDDVRPGLLRRVVAPRLRGPVVRLRRPAGT